MCVYNMYVCVYIYIYIYTHIYEQRASQDSGKHKQKAAASRMGSGVPWCPEAQDVRGNAMFVLWYYFIRLFAINKTTIYHNSISFNRCRTSTTNDNDDDNSSTINNSNNNTKSSSGSSSSSSSSSSNDNSNNKDEHQWLQWTFQSPKNRGPRDLQLTCVEMLYDVCVHMYVYIYIYRYMCVYILVLLLLLLYIYIYIYTYTPLYIIWYTIT